MERFINRINNSSRYFYASYCMIFVAGFICFWFGYLLYGKGFIWTVDGVEQQYPFFIMQGEWLRELLENIFINHTFIIPMWNESIGYGADYVYSLGNTIGNPINWLSVFATPETADLWLNATVPITLFLAGLSFITYCNYKSFNRVASLVGCMVYVFGGYSMIAFTQIYMLYPLIIGPLVLFGVDKVFDRKSPVLFVGAMFLAFFCSVSLAYTTCLCLLVYCLVKVFNLKMESITPISFISWTGKILALICLAALIAGIMFYPNAQALLGQDRLGLDRDQSILYSFSYYLKIFDGFIYPVTVGEDCMYGYAPVALLAVFALFFSKRLNIEPNTRRILRILFIVMTLFLCLPFIGRLFNGMAYANNRWVWAYSLLVSLILVIALPGLMQAIREGDNRPLWACCGYGLISMVFLAWYSSKTFYIMAAILFFVVAVMYACKSRPSLVYGGVICTLAAGCLLISYNFGHVSAGSQVDLGDSYSLTVANNPASLVMKLPDASVERYDSAGVHVWRNGNIASGTQGSTFYNSLYNSYIDEYHTSLGLVTSSMNFSYATFNGRTTLELLAGTKYFLSQLGDQPLRSPLYDKLVVDAEFGGVPYAVYEARSVMPFAYIGSSAISRDSYNCMSLMERQDALTQGVVLEDSQENSEPSLETYSRSLPFTLDYEQNGIDDIAFNDDMTNTEKEKSVLIEGNSITVNNPNTVLYLNVELPVGEEAYFVVQGMDYTPLASGISITNSDDTSFNALQTVLSVIKSQTAKECKLNVSADGMMQEIWFMNNKHHLYGGKDDWAVNVGTSDEERHCIALQFSNPGTYTFDSLGVYATDLSEVISGAADMSSNSVDSLETIPNGYKATYTADAGDRYIYFRVPYGEGWTAIVDGSEVKLDRANLAFMAIPAESGTHEVLLSYETPYLKIGALLSAIGVLLAGVLYIFYKKKSVVRHDSNPQ